jgi:hypothetical protein
MATKFYMSHGCENTNLMLIDGCGLVPPTLAEVVRYTGSSSLRKVPEDLSASAWQALMESVDYCPMGNILTKTFGGKPKQAAVSRDVVLWKVSSS